MKAFYFLAISIALAACSGQVDFSNPKSVTEYYYSLKEDGEKLELQYELLADTCKEFAILQDFEEFQMRDSLTDQYDFIVQKIHQLPFNPKHPKYRLFEIEYIQVGTGDQDTTEGISYETAFNEKGQWKIMWTSNIRQAGDNLMDSQKYLDAIQAYREALKYNPLDGKSYKSIGWCQLRQNEYKDALKSVKEAISLWPRDPANYNLLARIYYDQFLYELAIETYKKAIEMSFKDEHKSMSWSGMAQAYMYSGELDEAKKAIDHGLKLGPNSTYAWAVKGGLHSIKDEPDSAIFSYRKAVSFEPMSDNSQAAIFYILARMEYRKALSIDDDKMREDLLVDAKKHVLEALEIDYQNSMYRSLLNDITIKAL